MGIVDTPFFVRSGYGYDRGFDDFVWVRGQGDDTRPQERSDYRATESESDRLVARTVTEGRALAGAALQRELLLYVDTWDPHEPWDAPSTIPGCTGRDTRDGSSTRATASGRKRAHAGRHRPRPCYYCGEVTMFDFWIGRLLAKLDVSA